MKRCIFLGFIVLFIVFPGLRIEACTLWAANGSFVEGGGSLIVKNRDWSPQRQTVRLVSPSQGYRYFGLFVIDGDSKGLKAGINEKGLVAVTASASSIPRKERKQMPYIPALRHLLNECSSVDEAIAKTEFFVGPQTLLLADKDNIAAIEIGPEGRYAITVKKNEAIYHTNHYVDQSLKEFNRAIGASSQMRYSRIGELLSDSARPYNLDTFLTFSSDQNDGPDNSIFRTGSTPKKERTLAVWAVSIPLDKSPELYIKIMNPGEEERVMRLSADDVFAGEIQTDIIY